MKASDHTTSITQEDVRAALEYEPDTGIFRWRHRRPGVAYAGKVAGRTQSCGYIQIAFCNRFYYAHRLAWLYVYGQWPNEQIDHINGNRSDNRLLNLRQATVQTNAINAKLRRDSTSGAKGVSFVKKDKAWRAAIVVNGRTISLGYFRTKDAAACAYAAAARQHYGEFARASPQAPGAMPETKSTVGE